MAAASVITGGNPADTVTRITRLEMRADQVDQKRLAPP
jgi:hypothetical protein